MRVRFARVLGVRSRAPYVHAFVDGNSVSWRGTTGAEPWRCDCLDETSGPVCDHVSAVIDLLDARVLGGNRPRKETNRAR